MAQVFKARSSSFYSGQPRKITMRSGIEHAMAKLLEIRDAMLTFQTYTTQPRVKPDNDPRRKHFQIFFTGYIYIKNKIF